MIVLNFHLNWHVEYNYNAKVKQLVVTNCSKERPDSIVTKTLKNGILILIDTSKESDFYDDCNI